MGLFQIGDFTLNSGVKSWFKIDCVALSDGDINTLAEMIRQMIGSFSSVEGVPRGGLRLAKALEQHVVRPRTGQPQRSVHLIVDDVLTTGGSMKRAREDRQNHWPWKSLGVPAKEIVGAVIFARGPCPPWIKSLLPLPERFWPDLIVQRRG